MTEVGTTKSVSGAAFWSLYRRLGKWQWRGLLASAVSTIGGFFGQVYNYFIADPLMNKSVTWNATISWHALVAGLAFLLAFALLFFLRSFFKWAALVVVVLVVGGIAVSYMTGTNIDTSTVRDNSGSGMNWLWRQARGLIGLFTHNVPGGVAAALGGWLGFARPR